MKINFMDIQTRKRKLKKLEITNREMLIKKLYDDRELTQKLIMKKEMNGFIRFLIGLIISDSEKRENILKKIQTFNSVDPELDALKEILRLKNENLSLIDDDFEISAYQDMEYPVLRKVRKF